MKHIVYIVSFLFLIIPMSSTYACGSYSQKKETKKTCCENKSQKTQKKSCCDYDNEDYNGCKGGCNNTDCHCPSTINAPIPVTNLIVDLNLNLNLIKINWAYVQHAPQPIYLSIWQPPNIH